MNRIILEHGVKTSVKLDVILEPKAVELPKYALDEVVSLYDVLPQLSFDVDDTIKIISGMDNSNVEMARLVNYFNKQNTQQKYNDHDGVPITATMISKLNGLIRT